MAANNAAHQASNCLGAPFLFGLALTLKRNEARIVFPLMPGLAWAGDSGWRYNPSRVDPILCDVVELVAQPKEKQKIG